MVFRSAVAVAFASTASALQVGQPAVPQRGAASVRASLGGVRCVVDDKVEVKDYFNTEGFDRWSRIYSEDGEVNAVQLDIRTGHGQTVDKVLAWVDADGTAKAGGTWCDAGCGVGSLALPLAKRGAMVTASDISSAMADEAAKRADAAGLSDRATFSTSDLENIEGKYDTISCIDVMIHYPQARTAGRPPRSLALPAGRSSAREPRAPALAHRPPPTALAAQDKMAEMVRGLASKAEKRMIISFAPDTWYYRALKSFGELFPGPSKTTRAYLHSEEAVVAAIKSAGLTIKRTEMTGTNFYFSRLLEATRE